MIELHNRNAIDLLKEMESESIDLFVSDVPYMIARRGTTMLHGCLADILGKEGKLFCHSEIEFKDYLSDVYRVLKDGTHCYIMVNHFNLLTLLKEAEKVGFKFMKCLIWAKSAVIYTNYYMNAFEYIVFFRKGKDRRINNKGTKDVLNVPFMKTKENGENIHPTEKPVELMEILIENSSNVGETILDCFMGSGTTGVACKKLNRNFIGCELDKKYFDIAERRINETGNNN